MQRIHCGRMPKIPNKQYSQKKSPVRMLHETLERALNVIPEASLLLIHKHNKPTEIPANDAEAWTDVRAKYNRCLR